MYVTLKQMQVLSYRNPQEKAISGPLFQMAIFGLNGFLKDALSDITVRLLFISYTKVTWKFVLFSFSENRYRITVCLHDSSGVRQAKNRNSSTVGNRSAGMNSHDGFFTGLPSHKPAYSDTAGILHSETI